MLTRWTQHLKNHAEKEEAFKKEIYSAKPVLERLRAIVEEDERTLDRSEMNPEAYTKPNWDYHQAHKNGIRQYLTQIKTLIDLDQQRN